MFLDDGLTPATGLVAGDFSVKKRAKQNAAFGDFDTFTLTERAYGVYDVTCANTDTNTDGSLHVHLEGTGLDPVDKEFEITAAALTVAGIADGVWDEDLSGHSTAGSTGQVLDEARDFASANNSYISVNLDATVSSRASAADLATVQGDTNDIQTRLPAALVGGRMDSSVGAVANDAITAASVAGDVSAEIADAVWEEASADHNNAGTMGELQNLTLTAAVEAQAARIRATDIQARLPAALVGGRMDSTVGAMANNVITANAIAADAGTEIAAAILDAARTGHVILGSIGEAISLSAALLQGNFYMDEVDNSDPNGQTSARLRVFHDGATTAAATPGGSGEGEFATFVVTTTYEGVGKIVDHRVVQQ